MRERIREAHEFVGIYHGSKVIERAAGLEARQDLVLIVFIGVAELEAHKETVELGFGKWEGAFELDGVLCGNDKERAWERSGDALDGDLALLHSFEECRLGAGRGSVDLVGEDDLGDERTFTEDELADLLVVEVDAGDVGGHEVRRELDTAEGAAEATSDSFCESGLANAGDIFKKNVAFAEERDHRESDDFGLADDDALHAVLEAFGDGADLIHLSGCKSFGGNGLSHARMVTVGTRACDFHPRSRGAESPVHRLWVGNAIVAERKLGRVTGVQRIELGYNNVYRVGASMLVDTGPDYEGARAALVAETPERPDIVVATHGHLDHAGLGKYWQDAGVPVAMGAADAHLAESPQLSSWGEFEDFVRFVNESGAPAEVGAEVIAGLEQRRVWAKAAAVAADYPSMGRAGRWPTGLRYEHFEPARVVSDGDLVDGLEVLLCPGHTPGNLVLVSREEGWLFSGDQLLPEITPTPSIQPKPPGHEGDWRFRSLPAFVAALERLQSIELSRCFPGHGEPFDNVTETIRTNLLQVEQRTERVREALAALGCPTLYELCESLYPRALRRRFWQIVSTVQGHLDVLEAGARVGLRAGRYELL